MSAQAKAASKTSAAPNKFSPAPSRILQRKCACGGSSGVSGECEGCQKKRLQRKLAIGASNDPLELEADRVADQVMANPTHDAVASSPPRIQRFTGQSAGQQDVAPASVDRVLAGSGRPLEPTLRQDMEQRFGHDFSQVRVHSGEAAEQSARDVNANAYTVGHNIVFGASRFAPSENEGRRLIAHELTHVIQQSWGRLKKLTYNTSTTKNMSTTSKSNEITPVVNVSRSSSMRLARSSISDIIQEIGPEEKKELIEFWEGKVKQEQTPKTRMRYQSYVENLRTGAPLNADDAGYKSEEEIRYFYRKYGSAKEDAYKNGRAGLPRGGPTSKGTTKPDVALSVGDIEVKARDLTNPDNARVVIREIRRQVAERTVHGRANAKQQGVVLDVREQNVTPAQIEAVVDQLTTPAQVNVPGEANPVTVSIPRQNIQIFTNQGQILKPQAGQGSPQVPAGGTAKAAAAPAVKIPGDKPPTSEIPAGSVEAHKPITPPVESPTVKPPPAEIPAGSAEVPKPIASTLKSPTVKPPSAEIPAGSMEADVAGGVEGGFGILVRSHVAQLAIFIAIDLASRWLLSKLFEQQLKIDLNNILQPQLTKKLEELQPKIAALRGNKKLFVRITYDFQFSRSTDGLANPSPPFYFLGSVKLVNVHPGNEELDFEPSNSEKSEKLPLLNELVTVRNSFSFLIDDPQKRALDNERKDLTDKLQSIAKQQRSKAPSPSPPARPQTQAAPLLPQLSTPAPAPPPSFLQRPGNELGLSKAEQADQAIKSLEAIGEKLVERGLALQGLKRSGNRPSADDFIKDEDQWRTMVNYWRNWSEREGLDSRVTRFKDLLGDPARAGQKLEKLCQELAP